MNRNIQRVQIKFVLQMFLCLFVISSLISLPGYKIMNLNNSNQIFQVTDHEVTLF